MDCNTGLQLGRQFNKDASMMHGGIHMDPAMAEQDMLMGMPGVMSPTGGDWAGAFAMQQQQQMAAMRQQHEMEQAFLQQQHQQQHVQSAAQRGQAVMQNPMQGMQHANMSMMAMSGLGMGMMMPHSTYQPMQGMQPQQQMMPQQKPVTVAPVSQNDSAWAEQLGQKEWAQDYSTAQTFNMEGQADQTMEEKSKESGFYQFMDRVKNRELLIDEEKGEIVAGPGPEVETAEDTENLRHLADVAGLDMPPGVFEPQTMGDSEAPYVMEPDMADNDVEDWVQEYAAMQEKVNQSMNNTDYPFEPNNPYVHQDDPFAQAHEFLQLGNLAEACLALEAVCQRENENAQAWRLLGTTQAENEKDALAIIALNNAKRIDPRDLEVYAALSTSHTNEHHTELAMECLKLWLVHHPEYEQLGNITMEPDPDHDLEMTDTFFFADPTKLREVSTLYQAAVEMNPSDVQLYVNLGVLYNISHEFDMATENFRRAVELRPTDEKLWNKLGATLANGSHPEEALNAYNRALDINPGYVRAMYNMAVAYSNLGRYPQAARQVVKAIAMQEGDTNPTGEGFAMATQGMWEFLSMVLNLMDRNDLVDMAKSRNVKPFISEFGLEGKV